MNGQELVFLLREKIKQEYEEGLKALPTNLLSGNPDATLKAAATAGRIRAIEDFDGWLTDVVKGMQGEAF